MANPKDDVTITAGSIPTDYERGLATKKTGSKTSNRKSPSDPGLNFEKSNSKTFPVTLWKFNTDKVLIYPEIPKQLGVHPAGWFGIVNAVEVIFLLKDPTISQNNATYRCQQLIMPGEFWEQGVENSNKQWTKIANETQRLDDVSQASTFVKNAILSGKTQKYISTFDAPGFIPEMSDPYGGYSQLPGPAGVKTSKQATKVFLRQNFRLWVEASDSKSKNLTVDSWHRVSEYVDWHSIQSLDLVLFGKGTDRWRPNNFSEIKLGLSPLGMPAT